MAKIGTVLGGKYRLDKVIGRGGMSTVYLARDVRLEKDWAVKEIKKSVAGERNEAEGERKGIAGGRSEAALRRLMAETELMKQLDHPALPRIVDVFETSKILFVVMDYVEGETLDQVVAQDGPLSEDAVLVFGRQICEALDYLHHRKPPVIYRDMKPANLILSPSGNIKVIDFGIARTYKKRKLHDTEALGTRGYAPPEQHGGHQTDARSDIYALGMTLHFLLTGADPREPGYAYAPVRTFAPEVSKELEAIIERCTAFDPKDRYQTCGELLLDLKHPERSSEKARRRRKWKKRVTYFAAAAASLALLCSATLIAYGRHENKDRYEALMESVASAPFDEDYAFICDFYSNYAISTDSGRATPLDYQRLLEAMEDGMGESASQSTYEQMSFYHTVFLLLYDQRNFLYEMGIPCERVLPLFDEAYQRGMEEPGQEETIRLAKEMEGHYGAYREAIVRAYGRN